MGNFGITRNLHKKANAEIRKKIYEAGFVQWQIAEKLNMQEYAFTKLLRHEVSAEEREIILHAIEELKQEANACQKRN